MIGESPHPFVRGDCQVLLEIMPPRESSLSGIIIYSSENS